MALSANAIVKSKSPGRTLSYKVAADTVIYQGAIVMTTGGYLKPAVADAAAYFVGIAYEGSDNTGGADGDTECLVLYEGIYLLTGVNFAQADIGKPVFASADNAISEVDAGNEIACGNLAQYVSTTAGWIFIDNKVLA